MFYLNSDGDYMIYFISNEKELKLFIESKTLENYKFVIYGAGKKSKEVFDELKNLKIDVDLKFIVDNNKELCGSKMYNIEVVWYEDFLKLDGNYIVFYSLAKSKYIENIQEDFNIKNGKFELVRLIFPNKGLASFNGYLYRERITNKELNDEYNSMFYGHEQKVYSDLEPYYENGVVKIMDFESDSFNIKDGKRITINNEYKKYNSINKIKIFGDSRFFSIESIDEYTIQSILQKKIGKKYTVQNCALQYLKLYTMYEQIKAEKLNCGDIVVLNNVLLVKPNSVEYKKFTSKQSLYIYMNEVLRIKKYLDELSVHFIFVWLPSVKELSNPIGYEKVILEALEYSGENSEYYIPDFEYFNYDISSCNSELETFCNYSGITLCNLFADFDKKQESIYIDKVHISSRGNEIIATKIEEIVNNIYDYENDVYSNYVEDCRTYGNREFFKLIFSKGTIRQYVNELEKLSKYNSDNAGAIVMNANPFTKGHQFLVEQAVEQVDHLYVFVLEEDKSFFKFKDRFELVKKGTKHLKNVTVLPSGKAIISSITMPGYFTKETDSSQRLDASSDIAIFGNLIAPACKITKRFVGDEPFCKVTEQYNEQMKLSLNEFGIELVIINRHTTLEDNDIISATKVRKLLNEKDFDTLKKYVPDSTFSFLKKLNT